LLSGDGLPDELSLPNLNQSYAETAMINRRAMLTAALAAVGGRIATRTALAQAPMSRITAYAFAFKALDGGDIRLAEYTGRPMLIVNTASLCGYTPQYAGLQELWTEFHDRGLMIIGVPSNDFGGQEPGGATEIAETANHQYGVTFPIAAKAVVKGPNAHPFYKWAADARPRESSELELPQISGRSRRLPRRSFCLGRRPPGYAGQNRHRPLARGDLTRLPARGH
jgi:glutathione peroxidase